MKRLLQHEALGIGTDNFTSDDFDYKISNNVIEQILVNQEKKLHNGPWENSNYYNGRGSGDSKNVIGFIQWQIRDSKIIVNGNDDLVKIVYVNYLENRKEYRETKAVWSLLEKFFEVAIQPVVDEVGADRTFVNANFANEKLGRVIKRYVKNKMNIGWADDIKKIPGYEETEYELELDDDENIDAALQYITAFCPYATINPERTGIIVNEDSMNTLIEMGGEEQDIQEFGCSFDDNGTLSVAYTYNDPSSWNSAPLVFPPGNKFTFDYYQTSVELPRDSADKLAILSNREEIIDKFESKLHPTNYKIVGIGTLDNREKLIEQLNKMKSNQTTASIFYRLIKKNK